MDGWMDWYIRALIIMKICWKDVCDERNPSKNTALSPRLCLSWFLHTQSVCHRCGQWNVWKTDNVTVDFIFSFPNLSSGLEAVFRMCGVCLSVCKSILSTLSMHIQYVTDFSNRCRLSFCHRRVWDRGVIQMVSHGKDFNRRSRCFISPCLIDIGC